MIGMRAYCPTCPATHESYAGNDEWKMGPHPITLVCNDPNQENVHHGYCRECGKGYTMWYTVERLLENYKYNQPSREAIEKADIERVKEEERKQVDRAKKLLESLGYLIM